MNKLEFKLHLSTSEYTSLGITANQFESDIELLRTYYPDNIPSPNQLTDILDYCDVNDKKISYQFTKTVDETCFTAFIGTKYFANGRFYDFDSKTFSTHLK